MGIFFNVPVPVDVLIGVVREDRDRKFVFMGEPIDTILSVIPGKYVFRGDNLVVENADNADPSDMSFSFDLSVEDGYYSYKIRATIFDAATDEIVYGQSMPGYVFCKEGDTVNVKRSFRNLELKGDTDYILRVYWDDRFFPPEAIGHLAECKFRTKTSGIENVYGDYGQEAVRISAMANALSLKAMPEAWDIRYTQLMARLLQQGRQGPGRLVLRCLRASIWCEPEAGWPRYASDFAQSYRWSIRVFGNSEESGLSACIDLAFRSDARCSGSLRPRR